MILSQEEEDKALRYWMVYKSWKDDPSHKRFKGDFMGDIVDHFRYLHIMIEPILEETAKSIEVKP